MSSLDSNSVPYDLKPLSWSEMSLFRKDRQQWHTEYVLGEKPPPNKDMIRGSDIHAFLLEGVGKAIDPNLYFAPEIRIHHKIKDEFTKVVPFRGMEYEKRFTVDIDGVPFVGIWDAYALQETTLVELKTGKRLWDNERVKGHGQLYCYSLQHRILHGSIPKVLLASASTLSGKVIAYELEPSESDLLVTKDEIKQVWDDMGDLRYKRIKPIKK